MCLHPYTWHTDREPPPTTVLADKALAILLRRPILLAEIQKRFPAPEQIDKETKADWHQYWMDNPINALTGGNLKASLQEKVFFAIVDETFTYKNKVASDTLNTFETLLQEIVNCCLLGYNQRIAKQDKIVCKLFHSGGNPIIKLDDGQRANLPKGESELNINGRVYQANFAKIAVNVVRDISGRNVLPEILRGWFGPKAGMHSEKERVIFKKTGAGWEMVPLHYAPVQELK